MRYKIVTINSNNKISVKENLTYDEVYDIYNDMIENIKSMKITADNGHNMIKTYSIDHTWYEHTYVIITQKHRTHTMCIDELELGSMYTMDEKFKRWAKKF